MEKDLAFFYEVTSGPNVGFPISNTSGPNVTSLKRSLNLHKISVVIHKYRTAAIAHVLARCNCKYDRLYSTVGGKPLLGCFTRMFIVSAMSNARDYQLSTVSTVF